MHEAKTRLSELLRLVDGGQEIEISRGGEPIARIVPISGERALDRLIREGRVIPARQLERRRPQPLHGVGPVSDLVADQRR